MNTYIGKITVIWAVFGLSIVPLGGFIVNTAIAAETDNSGVNLSVENPGLLPTNPFYFLKSFKRNTQRAFTVSIVKKIDLELDILNQKSAEIQRLWEIMPDDNEAVLRALDAYQRSVDNLVSLAKKFGDIKEDSSYDRLAGKTIGFINKHFEILDELKASGEIRLKERIFDLQGKLGFVAVEIIKADGPDKFRDRFFSVLEGADVIRELRAVEVFDYFQDRLSADASERQYISRIKEDLILKAEALMNVNEDLGADLPVILGSSINDSLRRLKMLDEAREYIKNVSFKNNLSLIRQLVFDLAIRSRSIGKSEAEKMISDGGAIINFLNKRNEVFKSSLISNLISRAEFNLKQAQTSMTDGQYAQAVGQASAVMATLENALSQSVIIFNSGASSEIKRMKLAYDGLTGLAKENELNKENAPDLFALFFRVEKSIVALSDKNKKPEVLVPLLRDAKILLFSSEQVLRDRIEAGTSEE